MNSLELLSDCVVGATDRVAERRRLGTKHGGTAAHMAISSVNSIAQSGVDANQVLARDVLTRRRCRREVPLTGFPCPLT